eukprot:Hpha_TRINITY_DN29708_c0_g1::TRINITY_DN29708_c0_g1_i1::g.2533::m.2533
MAATAPAKVVTAAVFVGIACWRCLRREARVFMCCQQTAKFQKALGRFVGLRRISRIVAAMPPFNRVEGVSLHPHTEELNIPVFGPSISNATVALFDHADIRSRAATLGLRIPTYQFDTFVIGKLGKVRILVEAARARSDCHSGQNKQAVERLA